MRNFIVSVFVLFIALSGFSQLEVSEVSFYGETKAETSYLESVILTEVGDKVNAEELEIDRRNLVSLPLFGHVHLKDDTLNEKLHVTFELYEVNTVSPVLDFGGVKSNIYWQVGIANAFAFGKGISYRAFYRSTDNRGNFFINTRYPFINGTKIGIEIEASKEGSIEPVYFLNESVNYAYTKVNSSLSTFYNFTPAHTLNITGSYFTEDYDLRTEALEGVFPDNVFQKKVLLNSEFIINKIDYFYYKLKGWQSLIKLTHVFNLSESNFTLGFAQIKYFKHIGVNGNLGIRAQTGLATNTNSPFAPFVLDSNINIRGVGNRQERGTAQTSMNFEYRQTIFDNKSFAAQIIAYTDLGKWRAPGQEITEVLNFNDWRIFSGLGVRLISLRNYNAIFRVDYGLEPSGFLTNSASPRTGGVTFGLGQYF